MKAETFGCPHCGVELTKSAAAFVLGEARGYIVLGGMPEAVACPRCGGAIDAQAMIDGKYDRATGGAGAFFVWVAVTIGLWMYFESFWTACLIATGAAVGWGLLKALFRKSPAR